MRPSINDEKNYLEIKDTFAAKQWLGQFDTQDIPTAVSILKKVDYYSSSDIREGILELLEKKYENFSSEYIALYPVIDVPTKETKKKFSENYWEKLEKQKINLRDVGSDGEIIHLIRDICKKEKNFF